MMKHWKSSLAVIFLLLLFPISVLAAGSIDKNAQVTLTIDAQYGETPIKGMKFSAYQIASIEETGELTVNERFEKEQEALDIRGKNDSAWAKMAETLEREILLDETLRADAAQKTDSNGKAFFSELSQGLYLIIADGVEQQGFVYTVSAFFVVLPEQDTGKNEWNYQVTANAKPQRNEVLADYRVVKLWKDDCHKSQRPKSIEITLYRDGKAYETITLPENGRWEHTWKALSVNHHWTVTEKKQAGYEEPLISQNGNVFTILNTCSKPADSQGTRLPQTGQLWWPIPVLFGAGLFLILLGVIRRKGSLHEK